MEAARKQPVDIAKHLGISESAVSQWFSKDSGPKRERLPELAAFLNTTVAWLLSDSEGPPDSRQDGPSYPQVSVAHLPPPPFKPDIPLWASAAAGDEGAMILVPDPIDYLRRSERMMNVRNPFAFNIIGSSMEPAIEHGDQVVINPSIVARAGHNCVFIHEGPEGMLALVKRLVRPNSDTWRVRQYNEPKDFDLSRKKWPRVHPIAEVRKAGVG